MKIKQGHKYRGYIYTIPKAGTYLMSEFLSQIGLKSTGWHISVDEYLDTLGFDTETNKVHPSQTEKRRVYIDSFRRIQTGYHAFGHLSPLYVPPIILRNGFKCLCVKRNPKEVLVSEFIDFRYRRADVEFVSKNFYKNSIEAFERHLKFHGPVTKDIALNFALFEECANNPIYRELLGGSQFYIMDFKSFMSAKSGPRVASEIGQFYETDLTLDQVINKRQEALDADNKTKSSDVSIDVPREAFWSDRATTLYKDMGFLDIEAKLGYLK